MKSKSQRRRGRPLKFSSPTLSGPVTLPVAVWAVIHGQCDVASDSLFRLLSNPGNLDGLRAVIRNKTAPGFSLVTDRQDLCLPALTWALVVDPVNPGRSLGEALVHALLDDEVCWEMARTLEPQVGA